MSIAYFLAEFIGTFTLIFVGAGSICLNEMLGGDVGMVGIALAHGLAIAVMVSAVAHISGGKLNPAISIGALVGGKVTPKMAAFEIVAQLLGAIVAAFCLKFSFSPQIAEAVSLGTPALGEGVAPITAMFIEAILTFLLVFVVYGTAIDQRGYSKAVAGFAIGCTIVVAILGFGGVTGVAINPARAFGPALVSGQWANQLVWWIGPIVGGIAAGLVYGRLMMNKVHQ